MQKSLFKNTIYKAILSFVNIVIPLLIGPYVVKLLDVELYGIYNTVYAEFQVFLTFASFGLYTFGVREISKIRNDKEKISKFFTNLFLISIISNLLVCLIYFIYVFCTSEGVSLLLYCIMAIQFIGNAFYIEFVNEALENYKFITKKTVIIKILYLILILLFLRQPDDVAIYALIVSFIVFLNNIVSFIYAKKYIKFNFKEVRFKKYIKPLITILVITNVDLLYSQLDRVMLGKFNSNVSVTMYYIPYFIMYTLAAIPYSVINVSIPRLSYLVENESKTKYEEVLNKAVSSLLFIIVPICFGVLVLAKEVILIYAGEKYLIAVPILVAACLGRIITSIESTLIHLVMYPNNKEKIIMRYMLLFGIINLLSNSLLIIFDVFTPLTAIITTAIVEILLSVTLYIYAKNKLSINYILFSKSNIIYLLLCVMFIPISFVIRLLNFNFWINLIVIIICCSLLYVTILYVKKDNNLMLILDKILMKVGIKK